MKNQFLIFMIRWILTSCGIWLVITLFNGVKDGADPTVWTYLGAGLAFSIINSILKPIVVILSLPAIILTLGLFVVVVNGLMIYLAILLVPSLELTFIQAILAGIVLSGINYFISTLLQNDTHNIKHRKMV